MAGYISDEENDWATQEEYTWSMHDPRVTRSFTLYVRKYGDELSDLYAQFKTHGTTLFGGAFYQTGDFLDFARHVYAHTQPGIAH